MTAHDLVTGTSWAVIDRPYNSDASRLQLPIGLIMISPTRLFCRVRSGHLKYANIGVSRLFLSASSAQSAAYVFVVAAWPHCAFCAACGSVFFRFFTTLC